MRVITFTESGFELGILLYRVIAIFLGLWCGVHLRLGEAAALDDHRNYHRSWYIFLDSYHEDRGTSYAVLRILIVGAGPRGVEHGDAIRLLDGWTLAGIVDPRFEARERASKRLNVEPFSSLEESLERTDPDIVTISVPPLKRDDLIEAVIAQSKAQAIVIETM